MLGGERFRPGDGSDWLRVVVDQQATKKADQNQPAEPQVSLAA